MAVVILVLSLVATMAMNRGGVVEGDSEISKDVKALQEQMYESVPAIPQTEVPAVNDDQPAAEEQKPNKPIRIVLFEIREPPDSSVRLFSFDTTLWMY